MSNEELVALIQAGDRDRIVELWHQVQRMVYKQAARWAGLNGTTMEDLEQAGFIAMLRAVDSYDPSRGTKFSTYLFHRLRAELSAATGYNSKRSWFDPLQNAVSLDAPLEDSEDATLADFIPDPAAAAELAQQRAQQSEAVKKSRQKMYADAAAGDPEAQARYERHLAARRENYHRKKQAEAKAAQAS